MYFLLLQWVCVDDDNEGRSYRYRRHQIRNLSWHRTRTADFKIPFCCDSTVVFVGSFVRLWNLPRIYKIIFHSPTCVFYIKIGVLAASQGFAIAGRSSSWYGHWKAKYVYCGNVSLWCFMTICFYYGRSSHRCFAQFTIKLFRHEIFQRLQVQWRWFPRLNWRAMKIV